MGGHSVGSTRMVDPPAPCCLCTEMRSLKEDCEMTTHTTANVMKPGQLPIGGSHSCLTNLLEEADQKDEAKGKLRPQLGETTGGTQREMQTQSPSPMPHQAMEACHL